MTNVPFKCCLNWLKRNLLNYRRNISPILTSSTTTPNNMPSKIGIMNSNPSHFNPIIFHSQILKLMFLIYFIIKRNSNFLVHWFKMPINLSSIKLINFWKINFLKVAFLSYQLAVPKTIVGDIKNNKNNREISKN